MIKPIRVYVENSVFGGYFDKGFDVSTQKLFDLFNKGVYLPVISDHVTGELNLGAPERVKNLLSSIKYEYHLVTEEMEILTSKYMNEGIVTPKYESDALHIAIATILNVDVLVSWNFRHIVNFNKLRLFNSVNIREGYKILEVRTPEEVVEND